MNELIREKENMATEMWQLRRDVERLRSTNHNDDDPDSRKQHIDAFDPERPHVLRRKIGEFLPNSGGSVDRFD